jgi:hypothetical protein
LARPYGTFCVNLFFVIDWQTKEAQRSVNAWHFAVGRWTTTRAVVLPDNCRKQQAKPEELRKTFCQLPPLSGPEEQSPNTMVTTAMTERAKRARNKMVASRRWLWCVR